MVDGQEKKKVQVYGKNMVLVIVDVEANIHIDDGLCYSERPLNSREEC